MAAQHRVTNTDTYAAAYYTANHQDGDRVALRWYCSLVDRFSQPGRALDFGCGTGWLMKRLLASRSVDGLEQSEYALTVAKKNCPSSRFFADVSQAPSDSYAVITCIHVVEHLPEEDLDDVFTQWRRLLKPGGVVLLVTPDLGGRGEQIRGKKWRGYDDPTHVTLRSHAFWSDMFERHGFDVLAKGSDGLWDPPYGNWLLDRMRLASVVAQVLAGRLLIPAGSGESAVIIARARAH